MTFKQILLDFLNEYRRSNDLREADLEFKRTLFAYERSLKVPKALEVVKNADKVLPPEKPKTGADADVRKFLDAKIRVSPLDGEGPRKFPTYGQRGGTVEFSLRDAS